MLAGHIDCSQRGRILDSERRHVGDGLLTLADALLHIIDLPLHVVEGPLLALLHLNKHLLHLLELLEVVCLHLFELLLLIHHDGQRLSLRFLGAALAEEGLLVTVARVDSQA